MLNWCLVLGNIEREATTMSKIIAYCGLTCNNCPAFVATEKNDEEQKQKLSQEWSSPDYEVSPDEISCKGCNSGSEIVFKFCKECETRQCGIDKTINNCAHCDEYPCSKLDVPFKNSPQNKETLDKIRKSL